MGTKVSKSTMFGDALFGETLPGDSFDVLGIYDVAPIPDGIGRATIGWGVTGQRVYGRPEIFLFQPLAPARQDALGLTISTQSGAFLGRLRTDARRHIMRSIKFTLDDKGCADFAMVLNDVPDFPVLDFASVDLRPFDANFNWYSGILNDVPQKGTGNTEDEENKGYSYKGYGRRKALDTVKEDKDYPLLTDVGDMVDDLAENYIQPRTGIYYDPSKIDHPIGVLTVNETQLSKHPLGKVLDTLALMGDRSWGVDGENSLYFKNNHLGVKRTIFVGYGCEDIKIKTNIEAVKNSIFVQRQEGKGSGGSGWIVATIASDPTSISKYGKRELNYQVPGTLGDEECQLIADRLLEQLKEPSLSFQIRNVPVESSDDYYDAGTYRIVMPPGEFNDDVNDCEDAGEWSVSGSGDLAVSTDTTHVISGASSIRLQYTNALNDVAILTTPNQYKAFIKRIRVWVYCNRAAQLFTLGVGRTNWNENTVATSIDLSGQYFMIDWDVSALDLREIRKIGFKIDDNSGVPTSIFIDKISVLAHGHQTFEANLKRAQYTFDPNKQSVDLEFGELPPKMEQYLAGLFATASELKFTGEVR